MPGDDVDAFLALHGGAAGGGDDVDAFLAQHDAAARPSWLTTAKDVALGAAKGVGSTVYGLGKLFNENSFIGAQTGGYPARPDELTPTNTPQKVGYGAEQVGEFFIPGTKIATSAGLARRMALEALQTGAVATAQTGGDPRAVAEAAATGALGPVAGKAAEAVAPLIRKVARTQYGRALAATTKPLKADSKRIVPELLDRRVSGSLESLGERGATESAAVGKKLGAEYKAVSDAGVKSSTAPILQGIENAKAKFYGVKDLAPGTVGAGERIANNPAAIEKLDALKDLVAKYGDTVRPDQLWLLRQSVDDVVEAAGGFGGQIKRGTTKALQAQTRSIIQKELNKASPNIPSLAGEYSLWEGLQKVANATIQRKEGQSGIVEMGLRSGLGAGVGGAVGLAAGDSKEGATLGAVMGALANLTKHPRYRTVSAVQKARLADALASGKTATALTLVTRALAGLDEKRPTDAGALLREIDQARQARSLSPAAPPDVQRGAGKPADAPKITTVNRDGNRKAGTVRIQGSGEEGTLEGFESGPHGRVARVRIGGRLRFVRASQVEMVR